jgi:DNA helicase II / ATP-dependent DNA helicase PcrA
MCVSNVQAVLIDEFQDTNIVQLELMKLFSSKCSEITIVGDPDQSIYGFRSAEIQNLERMQKCYPDTCVLTLEENYRSSAAVLRAAQEVIEQDTRRPNKELKATHCYGTFPVLRRLPSAHDEAKWIVAEIRRLKAMTGDMTNFSDYAILLRSAHLSLLIENALGRAGIPYRMVGGYRFFDREEVRVLLDYLRTISHPENNAALSAIINVPSRKVGEESLKELLRVADEKETSLWGALQKFTRGEVSLNKRLSRPAEQKLCRLITLVKDAKRKMVTVSADSTPRFLLNYCIKELEYEQYLQSKHPEDHENRWANVQELVNQTADIAGKGSAADGNASEDSLPEIKGVERRELDANEEALSSFLANITLSSDLKSKEDGQEHECVMISTIHSAKGLEWPIVFIPAVYDGSIPHSRAEDTDEERRLLYVAMTRAQAQLYLTWPLQQSRDKGETAISPFLPQKLHKYFSHVGPIFTDKVVRDMALILRRTTPTQEELLKGLQSLSERESANDDLWPADGSARPRQWWQNEDEPLVASRMTKSATMLKDTGVQQNDIIDPTACATPFTTTMNNSKSFTFANVSVGFTTASHHLKINRESTNLASNAQMANKIGPESAASRSKKRKVKGTAGQGSLTTFFTQGSFNANTTVEIVRPVPEPDLPSFSPTNPMTTMVASQTPTTFSGHRVSMKPTSLKRPQPLQEIPNAKQKAYVFLSSSPTQEEHPKQSADGGLSQHTEARPEQEKTPIVPHKPVTTMHATSMDMLHSQNAVGVKKTYGVRRMMNGWESRKNK